MADEPAIRVTVLYSPGPRDVREWSIAMPAASTVLHALQASGLQREFPGVDLSAMTAGIWGRKATMSSTLREGDRVELYRGLRVDPKVARRERFRKQGIRSAGLFARKKGR